MAKIHYKGLGLFLLGAPAIWAQSTEDSLRVERLEEITIRAVRAASNDPVAQVTADRKVLEQNYYGQDGAFLLERLSPSLVSYSESGTSLSNYGQMRLRGIDQSRINITLNGVPLNDMIDQGVFFSNFVDFGNSIESVQIQRGVGTSTNGVASYAGSINFESVSLNRREASGAVRLTGGSFNTLMASGEVHSGLLPNRTAFYARISELHSDGYRYNTQTAARSFFFSGAYFGDRHALKFTGFAGRSQNGLAYLPVPINLIKQDPRTNLVSANDEDDFQQYLYQLQHTWRLGQKTNLVSTIYHGGAGGDFPVGFFDSTAVAFTQINYPLINRHWGAMSNLNWNHSFWGQWNLGLHAYRFTRENLEYIIPNRENPYYHDESEKQELAGFAKWQKTLGNFGLYADLQMRGLALRFQPDEVFLGQALAVPTRHYFFINPKVGLTYRLNEATQLFASVGRSGREPRRFDVLGAAQINSSNVSLVGEANSVQAEYVNDFEAGLRWRKERLNVQVNAFYMAFENEIAPIGENIPEGFVQIHENLAPSYRTGVEWAVHWQFLPRWRLQAQGTYLHSRISRYEEEETGRQFENVHAVLSPELILRGQLRCTVAPGLALQGEVRYLSEAFLDLTNNPNFTVPASLVFNASAEWQFWRQHRLRLELNNLDNLEYYTYGVVDQGNPAYFVQPPFHFYLTLQLQF